MNLQKKYDRVRTALLAFVGVEDDLQLLLLMLAEVNKLPESEDQRIALKALVTLIETHPDKNKRKRQ